MNLDKSKSIQNLNDNYIMNINLFVFKVKNLKHFGITNNLYKFITSIINFPIMIHYSSKYKSKLIIDSVNINKMDINNISVPSIANILALIIGILVVVIPITPKKKNGMFFFIVLMVCAFNEYNERYVRFKFVIPIE